MLEQLVFILTPSELDFRFLEEPIKEYIEDNLLQHNKLGSTLYHC